MSRVGVLPFSRPDTRRGRDVATALAWTACLAVASAGLPACHGFAGPESARSPVAEKWFTRADQEFREAQINAANDSVKHALELAPTDPEVKILAARVALARLEYGDVLRLLKGVLEPEAAGLRGRANWYKGELGPAADELDALLEDPEVIDPWAKAVSKLARQGAGRHPFTVEGFLAAVEMPRTEPGVPFYVVPVEIDGEEALALVSTGNAEVVLDSATRNQPSWVSLAFRGSDPERRFEVRDVPAMTQDLAAISHQLNAPIKALLGVNLLRRLHATLDHDGRQFVVRSFEPPPPPVASKVDLFYLRGGGLVMSGTFGSEDAAPAPLFIDTAMIHAVALDAAGWKKAGVDPAELSLLGQDAAQKLRGGTLPLLRFGSFERPHVRAVFGAPIEKIERELGIDVDGAVGAGFLSDYRVSFSDGGRTLWVEQRGTLESVTPLPLAPTAVPGPLEPMGPSNLLEGPPTP